MHSCSYSTFRTIEHYRKYAISDNNRQLEPDHHCWFLRCQGSSMKSDIKAQTGFAEVRSYLFYNLCSVKNGLPTNCPTPLRGFLLSAIQSKLTTMNTNPPQSPSIAALLGIAGFLLSVPLSLILATTVLLLMSRIIQPSASVSLVLLIGTFALFLISLIGSTACWLTRIRQESNLAILKVATFFHTGMLILMLFLMILG